MKNLSYENFYVDADHPRASLRDIENVSHEEKDQFKLYCYPIIIFHSLRNTDSKITFNSEPSLRRIEQLKDAYGINYILTCIKETNYDMNVKKITDYCDIGRIEVYLNFSKLQDLSIQMNKAKFINSVLEIYNKLKNENITLLIHKASGEIKTTIVLYSLLRLSGEKKEESIEIIRCLKNGNKKSIGDFNIEFIEKNIIQSLIKDY